MKQFHPEKEQFKEENRFGTDFNFIPDLPHFLGHIRKAGQTFLSIISQSLDPHFTRGWRCREETN